MSAARNLNLIEHADLNAIVSDDELEVNASTLRFRQPPERRLHPEDGKWQYPLGARITFLVTGRVGEVDLQTGTLTKKGFKADPDGEDVQRVHPVSLTQPRPLTQKQAMQVETVLAEADNAQTTEHRGEQMRALIERNAFAIVDALREDEREALARLLLPDASVTVAFSGDAPKAAPQHAEPEQGNLALGISVDEATAIVSGGHVEHEEAAVGREPFVDAATGAVIGDDDALADYLRTMGDEDAEALTDLFTLNRVDTIQALVSKGHTINWGHVQDDGTPTPAEPETAPDPEPQTPADTPAPQPLGVIVGKRETYTPDGLAKLTKQDLAAVLSDLTGTTHSTGSGTKAWLLENIGTALEQEAAEAPDPEQGGEVLDFA